MIYPTNHWSRLSWDRARWPDFTPRELACRCCGEMCLWPEAMDALQRLGSLIGSPLVIASGHRCAKHNADVGGATNSVHRSLAFNIALGTVERRTLLSLAREAGFSRFGLMRHGLHCDIHPLDTHHAPMWTYGTESRRLWAGLFPPDTPDLRAHQT